MISSRDEPLMTSAWEANKDRPPIVIIDECIYQLLQKFSLIPLNIDVVFFCRNLSMTSLKHIRRDVFENLSLLKKKL